MDTVPVTTTVPDAAVAYVMATLAKAASQGGPGWWRSRLQALYLSAVDRTRFGQDIATAIEARVAESSILIPAKGDTKGVTPLSWQQEVEALHPTLATGYDFGRWLTECYDHFGGKPILSVLDFRMVPEVACPSLARQLVPAGFAVPVAPPSVLPRFRHVMISEDKWVFPDGTSSCVRDDAVWPCFPKAATDVSFTHCPFSGDRWFRQPLVPPPGLQDLDDMLQGSCTYWVQDGMWYIIGPLPLTPKAEGTNSVQGVGILNLSQRVRDLVDQEYTQGHDIPDLHISPVWDGVVRVATGYPLKSWMDLIPPHMQVPNRTLEAFTRDLLRRVP
jgi:hypothetical protein